MSQFGFEAGYVRLPVHQLAGFGSRLLMRFFGWICMMVSSSACWIRLQIADAVVWFELLHCHYVSVGWIQLPIADAVLWLDLLDLPIASSLPHSGPDC